MLKCLTFCLLLANPCSGGRHRWDPDRPLRSPLPQPCPLERSRINVSFLQQQDAVEVSPQSPRFPSPVPQRSRFLGWLSAHLTVGSSLSPAACVVASWHRSKPGPPPCQPGEPPSEPFPDAWSLSVSSHLPLKAAPQPLGHLTHPGALSSHSFQLQWRLSGEVFLSPPLG